MGLSCSCPHALYCDFVSCSESKNALFIKTNDDDEDNVYEDTISSSIQKLRNSLILDPNSAEHEAAAIKLQKVYKSFRTRRRIADCAVLIEQSLWKLLDFAELKHSSVSFFHLRENETALSRWSRARTRAAKVGKGLSKNSKAQKLALQHWLEAIDPRHRYGHNLHFYYMKWLNSQSNEPFFYWLDLGEGKDVNLYDECSRSKLQLQCIKYLGPIERKAYEVEVIDGKLVYKQTGQRLNTTNCSKWIFVLSTSKTLYIGKKRKGSFQHSSFLAGGATLAAGRVVAENGVLKAVWPHSGHYRPTLENFQEFISFLKERKVDLVDVKLESIDDEEVSTGKNGNVYLRTNSIVDHTIEGGDLEIDEINTEDSISSCMLEESASGIEVPHAFTRNTTTLHIHPSRESVINCLKNENETTEDSSSERSISSVETNNISKSKYENILEEGIVGRFFLHKVRKSYQLGEQLCCKWSSGAGPRICCLRNYPLELQCHAFEQLNMSSATSISNLSCILDCH